MNFLACTFDYGAAEDKMNTMEKGELEALVSITEGHLSKCEFKRESPSLSIDILRSQ